MPVTQTPDPNCQFCAGTGLTFLMEDCPCSANYFVSEVKPEPKIIHAEDVLAEVAGSATAAATAMESVEKALKAVTAAKPSGPPATMGQTDFITTLVAERDEKHPLVASAALAVKIHLDGSRHLVKSEASKLIEELLKLPKTKLPIRVNRFPGECEVCGGPVDTGKGRIEKIDGKWKTFHLDGEHLTVEEAKAAKADAVCEPGVYRKAGAFYRVRRGRFDKEAFWAEKIWISAESVSFSRAGRATFLKASDRLTWKEARDLGVAYNACINCGKSLSDPQSVVAGYGKTCSETCGWPYPGAKLAKAVLAGEAEWEGI